MILSACVKHGSEEIKKYHYKDILGMVKTDFRYHNGQYEGQEESGSW